MAKSLVLQPQASDSILVSDRLLSNSSDISRHLIIISPQIKWKTTGLPGNFIKIAHGAPRIVLNAVQKIGNNKII